MVSAALDRSNDLLTVVTTSDTINLQLTGTYAAGTMVRYQADANSNGSDIFLSNATCFCRGTRIATERGEVPVEELAVGDRVVTVSGAVKPIVWIGMGRDRVTGRHSLARPVIVRHDALADGVPHRDLYLTHGHALYFSGVLIPVENLINHSSILWDEAARVVEYYHIELEDHDVLYAEGAPAESYHDADNRALFQTTRPGSAAGAKKPAFAPVLNGDGLVDLVWRRLNARAGGDLECDSISDPDLYLLIGGKRLDAAQVEQGVYTFTLESPPSTAPRLRSRRAVPSLLGVSPHDHRPLGVAIRRIEISQLGLVRWCLDHRSPLLRLDGCYPAEEHYCWTDGDVTLPLRLFTPLCGPLMLTVQTEGHGMRYPVAETQWRAA